MNLVVTLTGKVFTVMVVQTTLPSALMGIACWHLQRQESRTSKPANPSINLWITGDHRGKGRSGSAIGGGAVRTSSLGIPAPLPPTCRSPCITPNIRIRCPTNSAQNLQFISQCPPLLPYIPLGHFFHQSTIIQPTNLSRNHGGPITPWYDLDLDLIILFFDMTTEYVTDGFTTIQSE